jgi:hypothetical protein
MIIRTLLTFLFFFMLNHVVTQAKNLRDKEGILKEQGENLATTLSDGSAKGLGMNTIPRDQYNTDFFEEVLGFANEEKMLNDGMKAKQQDTHSFEILPQGRISSSSIDSSEAPDSFSNLDSKFGLALRHGHSKERGGGHHKWPWCAWPISLEKNVFTPLLMDPEAVYQAQLLEFAEDDQDGRRVYRFRSSYQQGVYFSYSAYAIRGKYSSGIQDTKISPLWGCNPYTDLGCTRETSGGYEIYVTRYGDTGRYSHEIGMINRAKEFAEDNTYLGQYQAIADLDKTLGTMLLRIYYAREMIDKWGGVQPPVIEVSNDYGATFSVVDQCSESDSLKFNNFLENLYQRRQPRNYDFLDENVSDFLLEDYPKERRRKDHCPLYNDLSEKEVLDNPGLYPQLLSADDEGTVGFEPYSNPDSHYLFYCNIYQPSETCIEGAKTFLDNYLVLGVIDGASVPVADGLYEGEGRRVADPSAWGTRYASFETAETTVPQPSFTSLSIAKLQAKYGYDWDRRYRILTSMTERDNHQEQESCLRSCYSNLKASGHLKTLENEEMYDFNHSELPYLPFYPTHDIEPNRHQFFPLIPTWIYRLQDQKSNLIEDIEDECNALPMASEERKSKCFSNDFLQDQFAPNYPDFNLYLCDKHTNQGIAFSGHQFEQIIKNVQYSPIQ